MTVPRNLSVMARRTLGLFVAAALVACGGSSDKAQTGARVERDATNGAPSATETATLETASETLIKGTPSEGAADAFVIVMLGDSLTAGFGLPEDDAPPALIEERLRGQGLNVDVINAGVSGDTTAGGLARYDWSVASAKPDLLVIALGANDYLGGVTPARARQNLNAIIGRAQEAALPIALVGLRGALRRRPPR